MIVAGVDIGTDYTQAVIVDDGELAATGEGRTGFDLDVAVDRALSDALEETEYDEDDVDEIVATGEGRKSVGVDQQTTSYKAIAVGLREQWPEARTVLLMGAKNAAALKLDDQGNVLDFDENDKCAAGVGRFLSDLTRFLDMDLEEMIEAARSVDEGVEGLNTQCSVFAESDVISLIHEGASEANIARGVHDAIAERNSSLIRRVGVEDDVLVVGGVGRNQAFVDVFEENIGNEVHVPENPAHVAAYGAALLAISDDDVEVEAEGPSEEETDVFKQQLGD